MNKKVKRRRRSKFLFRRVMIIGVVVLVVYGIFNLIGFAFEFFTKKDDKVITIIPTTEFNEVPIDVDAESTESTTDPNAEDPSAETTTDPNTESSTDPDSETSTESEQVGGGTNMNFESVSYYSIRLNSRYSAYAEKHPEYSVENVVLNVNMNLDHAFYEGIEIINNPDDLEAICNKFYALPEDFSPSNLKSVPEGYFVADGKEYILDQDALDAFVKMSDEAKKSDLSLKIISAYRSFSYQSKLYDKYKAANGQSTADRFSARPRHSEHETGLAIDINDVSQAFENTKEFTWLQDNAHKYGFILRYPKGKEDVTGYMYEPWHYRYLGVDLATKVKESGLTYDAYFAKYFFK